MRGADGVVSGAAAQPRRLAILALLASAGEPGLTREKVLAYLWPDAEEDRARRGLSQALYALRQDLGDDEVFIGTRDLRLNADLVSSDVAEFSRALSAGRLDTAVGHYTGAFLDGFHLPGAPEFDRWAEEERAGLAHRYAESLEKLARRAEERGEAAEAVSWWRRLAAQDPLNARVAVGLMRALVAAGDRAGALQHSRIYEVLMEQDLDAPPDREVVALAAELRREDVSPGALAPAVGIGRPDGSLRAPAVAAAAVGEPVTEPAVSAPALRAPAAIAPAAVAPAASGPGVGNAAAARSTTADATSVSPPAARRARFRRPLIAGALLAAGYAGGVLLTRRITTDLVPGAATRVAFDDRLELDPAIAPDGETVAYAADVGDRLQIFVRRRDGGPAVPVSAALAGSHWRPRWAPGGGRLAFQSGGSIYAVDALGGTPRVLVRPSRPGHWVAYPAWSPDGKAIAYAENWVVYAQAAEGGPARLITDRVPAHSLSWSPDGLLLAFVSGNPVFAYGETPWGSQTNLGNVAPSSIWVVPAAGGTPVQVTDARALNTSPVWLPDSRGLLFVSSRDGARDVYRIEIDGTGRAVGQPERVTTGLSAHGISLSADAGKLAYSAFTNTSNVWSLEIPKRAAVSSAAARPFTEGNQVIEGLALSPDGRSIAFDSDRAGSQDVYRMPLAGGEAVRLTSSNDDEFVSSWSGDGREIALHAYHAGARVVRIVSAEGGPSRDVVASPPNQRSPGFSPDGRQLVFTAELEGQRRLYVVAKVGAVEWGAARQLTREEGWGGRWAPDGRTIVYCRPDGLWLISPDGTNRRRLLTQDGGGGGAGAASAPELALWSPDGRTIYYKAFDAAGRSSLWAVPVGGGAPRLLVRFDDPARPSNRAEFGADGQRLYFTMGARQSDVWVMALGRRK